MTYDHRLVEPEGKEYWEERNRQVKYIKQKLDWQKSQILEAKQEFPSFVKEWSKSQGIEENAFLEAKKKLLKNNRGEDLEDGYITEQVFIESIKHPLSYQIESYLIERKRLLEHGLKLVRDTVNPNKSDSSLSPESFLRSLDEDLDEKSWQYQILDLDLNLYLFFLRHEDELWDIINKRTRLTHYQAENRKKIEVEFPMAEIKNGTIRRIQEDSPRDFTIELDDKVLEKFLEDNEELLNEFLERIEVAMNRYITVQRFLAIATNYGKE